jgi:hypothetical protein
MPLTSCPRCGAAITDDVATCACGLDLNEIRADHARLMRPPAYLPWPFSVLRKLSPTARRQVIRDMARARSSRQ